jgi:hypothetical protein
MALYQGLTIGIFAPESSYFPAQKAVFFYKAVPEFGRTRSSDKRVGF